MGAQFHKRNKLIKWVMLAILFFYPLRHIFHGVDLWDTGYNYANFTYIDKMDSMWYFSTYFASIVGHFFTKLPLGDTYLGLNLYTGLTTSVLAVLGFWFCTEKVKLPVWIAFAGEFLAVCLSWCPTALLYNYLTYILLGVAVVFLYLALEKESDFTRVYFIVAGICLGLNIFVRFSNLAQASMILAVWAMAVIRREKFGKVVSQTFICLVGYLAGVFLGLIIVALRDSVGDYVNGIVRLLGMPSEAGDYTVVSMIYSQVINYVKNLRWIGCLLAMALVGVILFKVIPERVKAIAVMIYGCGIVGLFYLFYVQGMFTAGHDGLGTLFQWAVFFLIATHVIGLVVILGKDFSEKEKLICGLNMLVVLVTPLGSNNQLYAAMNNLYIVAPVTLWLIWRLVKWMPAKPALCGITISSMPLKLLIGAVVLFLGYQSAAFSIRYVFTEATGGKEHTTYVSENEVLKWVRTDEQKAEVLNGITAFVEENDLKGKEVLLFGNVPSLSFYLEMPYVLSPWPDLRSYNLAVMEEGLAKLQKDIDDNNRECPVIILSPMIQLNENSTEKEKLLMAMIEKYGYEKSYVNDSFIVLMAEM